MEHDVSWVAEDGTLHRPLDAAFTESPTGLRSIERRSKVTGEVITYVPKGRGRRIVASTPGAIVGKRTRKRDTRVEPASRTRTGYKRELPDARQAAAHFAISAPARYRGPGWEVRSEASPVISRKATLDDYRRRAEREDHGRTIGRESFGHRCTSACLHDPIRNFTL